MFASGERKEFVMDILERLFPISWKYQKDVPNLIVGIVIYIVLAILAGALITLATFITGWIPVLGALIGWLLGIVSSLFGLYLLVGIILSILLYFKVIRT